MKACEEDIHWMIPHNDRTMNGRLIFRVIGFIFRASNFFLSARDDAFFEKQRSVRKQPFVLFIGIVVKKVMFARASLLISSRGRRVRIWSGRISRYHEAKCLGISRLARQQWVTATPTCCHRRHLRDNVPTRSLSRLPALVSRMKSLHGQL